MSIPGQHPHAGPNPAHSSPATALTSEDEEPQRCLQRRAHHGGLHGLVAESCQEQSRMSSALQQRREVPQPPFSSLETSHLFPVFSLSLPAGWLVPSQAGSAEGTVSKASPAGKQGFCWRLQQLCQLLLIQVNSSQSVLKMPLPQLQSPASVSLCSTSCLFFP